ncbi:MAG: DUF2510 domain-containing protein [Acidobacteria bacterium]|nr:MAG: DUF2510 domain-containing protein [Acidobacteriota bacterium]
MTPPSKGWYTDPTSEYQYRYWNGTQWTNQVSSSGTTLNDPNAMDPSAAATPPAPGSEAASPPQADVAPTVQVTQKSGGFGTVIGVIVAIVAIVILIVVLMNQNGDDSPTSDTEAPAPAPVTTIAP